MKKKTLLQAILGIVVMGILAWIVFRFVVPSMQSSFDSPPVERYAFINVQGIETDSVSMDSAAVAQRHFADSINANPALLEKFTKLVSDEIHAYARNMNMTKYTDIVIHDLKCIGYSEKHIELSYHCDYLPERTRYAYLYFPGDSTFFPVVGGADTEEKTFNFFFGISHFHKQKAQVEISMNRPGRRLTITLHNEIIDDIGRVVKHGLMFPSLSDDGTIVGYSPSGEWVRLDEQLQTAAHFPKEISYVGGFHEGLARARKSKTDPGLFAPEDRWGFINLQSEWQIEPEYGYAEDFLYGRARIGILKPE